MKFNIVSVTLLNSDALMRQCSIRLDSVVDDVERTMMAYAHIQTNETRLNILKQKAHNFAREFPNAIMLGINAEVEDEFDQIMRPKMLLLEEINVLPAVHWLTWCAMLCSDIRTREERIVGNQLVQSINAIGLGILFRSYEQVSKNPSEPFTLRLIK